MSSLQQSPMCDSSETGGGSATGRDRVHMSREPRSPRLSQARCAFATNCH